MKKGFTLIEMLIVLAIIAALILIFAPDSKETISRGQSTTNSAVLKGIDTALVQYQIANQSMPTAADITPSAEAVQGIKDELAAQGSADPNADYALMAGSFKTFDKSKLSPYMSGTKALNEYFLISEASPKLAGYVVSNKKLTTSEDKVAKIRFIPPNGLFVSGGGSPTVSFDTVSTLSLGRYHSAAIKSDGTLWTWGRNDFGQLGVGDKVNRSVPVKVGTATDWKSLSFGTEFSAAIKTDGTLWTWGRGGVIGQGDFTDRLVPTKVETATDWKMISAGDSSSAAIKTDGTLWTWGYNGEGQLGQGDTVSRFTPPVNVGNETNWKTVSAKYHQVAAIKTDGTLWTWGYNIDGMLGHGDTASRTSPTRVGTETDWRMAQAGTKHTAAIKTDGTLWTWGRNVWGELGVGDTTNRKVPVKVGTATDWKSVSLGDSFSTAIKTDGTLWTWGVNAYGQLGQGDTASRNTPSKVGMMANWNSVACGEAQCASTRSDGTLFTWGYNNYGQLGQNDTSNRLAPTAVPGW